jgi:hypothetical protein
MNVFGRPSTNRGAAINEPKKRKIKITRNGGKELCLNHLEHSKFCEHVQRFVEKPTKK